MKANLDFLNNYRPKNKQIKVSNVSNKTALKSNNRLEFLKGPSSQIVNDTLLTKLIHRWHYSRYRMPIQLIYRFFMLFIPFLYDWTSGDLSNFGIIAVEFNPAIYLIAASIHTRRNFTGDRVSTLSSAN